MNPRIRRRRMDLQWDRTGFLPRRGRSGRRFAGSEAAELVLQAKGGSGAERREPPSASAAPKGVRAPLERPRGVHGGPHLVPGVERRGRGRGVGAEAHRGDPRAHRRAERRDPRPSSAFERGQWATGTSASASIAIISAASSVTQCAQRSSGRAPRRGSRRPALPVGATSVSRRLQQAVAMFEPLVLAVALGEVRTHGNPERQAVAVDLERARMPSMGRDPDPERARTPKRRSEGSRSALPPPWGRCRTPRGRRSPADQSSLARPRQRRRSWQSAVRRDPGRQRVSDAAPVAIATISSRPSFRFRVMYVPSQELNGWPSPKPA